MVQFMHSLAALGSSRKKPNSPPTTSPKKGLEFPESGGGGVENKFSSVGEVPVLIYIFWNYTLHDRKARSELN